jgi:hypothetical protein
MMVVAVKALAGAKPTFDASTPQPLFEAHLVRLWFAKNTSVVESGRSTTLDISLEVSNGPVESGFWSLRRATNIVSSS